VASFTLQGLRSVTGSVTLTASSTQFTDGTLGVEVVQPRLQINALASTTNTLAADDEFRIFTGVANASGNIQNYQGVSAEGTLTVTVTSSNPAVGVPTTLASGPVSPNTVEIAVNATVSPNTLAQGGIAFDALAAGTTTITATAPGFAATNPPSGNAVNQVDVTVNP